MPFDATDYREVRLLDRDPKTLTDPRERLEYLRDFLRELPDERFDMRGVFHVNGALTTLTPDPRDCGTAACILGWSQLLFDDGEDGELLFGGYDFARSSALFMPPGYSIYPKDHYSRAQAANVLDHLLKTGEVDWSVA